LAGGAHRRKVHVWSGEHDEALRCYIESEAIFRELGNRAGLGYNLRGRAIVRLKQHTASTSPALLREALEAAEECRSIREEIGQGRTAEFFTTLGVLAGIHHHLGDPAAARQHAEAASQLAAELSITRDYHDPNVRDAWGWLDLALGSDYAS
jgi:hypothetical protein